MGSPLVFNPVLLLDCIRKPWTQIFPLILNIGLSCGIPTSENTWRLRPNHLQVFSHVSYMTVTCGCIRGDKLNFLFIGL